MNSTFTLEERLIDFACCIIKISENLPKTQAANHLSNQLMRSGTDPALQYGEAQSGESRSDFIHKMKLALKELREAYNCLRIVQKMNWLESNKLMSILNENNQLNSIFVSSIKTAQKNMEQEKPKKVPTRKC